MRRSMFILAGALLLGASPAWAQFSISTDGDQVTDCSDLRVRSDEYEIARGEESFDVPAGALHIAPSTNGGAWIFGGTAAQYSVIACKIAAARDTGRAHELLANVQVTRESGRIGSGPATGKWVVYFIVHAPRGSTLSVETTNGPIAISGVEGNVSAHATNGPIGIKDSRGDISAETENGPISIARTSGDVKLRAQNGPLSVKLEGLEWQGRGLEGRTQNGPLSVSVPRGYQSGVVVETAGHSPVNCSGCDQARRTWDDDGKRIEFGTAPERVKLRTMNGPVSVKQAPNN